MCYCVRMFVCACSCMCRYDVVSSGFADWTSTLLSKRDWRKRVSGGKLRSLPLFARCSPHFSLALPPSIHPSIYPSSFPYPSPSHQTFPSHSSPSSPFPFSLLHQLLPFMSFFLLCPLPISNHGRACAHIRRQDSLARKRRWVGSDSF